MNDTYEQFLKLYGNLNARSNIGLIKMDASSADVLALERVRNGEFIKADIFDHPVAFSLNEIDHLESPLEALSASLNKFGIVNLKYMSDLTNTSENELVEELKGQIYFNPLVNNYEIAERFIAGNVIEKIESIEEFLINNAKTDKREEAINARKEATPRPISLDEVDCNFGESWIPTGIYYRCASFIFVTDVNIAH